MLVRVRLLNGYTHCNDAGSSGRHPRVTWLYNAYTKSTIKQQDFHRVITVNRSECMDNPHGQTPNPNILGKISTETRNVLILKQSTMSYLPGSLFYGRFDRTLQKAVG